MLLSVCSGSPCTGLEVRLDAVHRALDIGIEIRHAQTDAIETLLAQHTHPVWRDGAQVDLDRIFATDVRWDCKSAL